MKNGQKWQKKRKTPFQKVKIDLQLRFEIKKMSYQNDYQKG
jgi:hypothetical protein